MKKVKIELDLKDGYKMVPEVFIDGERIEFLYDIKFEWETAKEHGISKYNLSYRSNIIMPNEQVLTEKCIYKSPLKIFDEE